MAGRKALPAAALKSAAGHRTKAEIETREKAEKALLTGKRLVESADVKKDKVAHAEYKRVSELLAVIEKDDALYSGVVNRYCLLSSEAAYYKAQIDELKEQAAAAKDKLGLMRQITTIDSTLAAKRRDMLAIEREMCLTLAAALRAIPKQPQQEDDALKDILSKIAEEDAD